MPHNTIEGSIRLVFQTANRLTKLFPQLRSCRVILSPRAAWEIHSGNEWAHNNGGSEKYATREEQVVIAENTIQQYQADNNLSGIPKSLELVESWRYWHKRDNLRDTPFCEAFRNLRDEQSVNAQDKSD